jgi:hypothetical protein
MHVTHYYNMLSKLEMYWIYCNAYGHKGAMVSLAKTRRDHVTQHVYSRIASGEA